MGALAAYAAHLVHNIDTRVERENPISHVLTTTKEDDKLIVTLSTATAVTVLEYREGASFCKRFFGTKHGSAVKILSGINKDGALCQGT